MKILINDTRKIAAIQEEFSGFFPFLKIEFFTKSNLQRNGMVFKLINEHNRLIGEIRNKQNSGDLILTPEMSVSMLENIFREIFGLNVQVFRKSGKAWLETTVTGDWSLQEQNAEGKALDANSDSKRGNISA